MKQFSLIYIAAILFALLTSCKSEEETMIEKTFKEFIKEDLTRFRGTYITVTATESDFKFDSYRILRKYTVRDSIHIIEAEAREYYPMQLRSLENSIASENNEVEWYDIQRDNSMNKPAGKWLIKKTKEFEELVEQGNDIAVQVQNFEGTTKGRHFRGLYNKYSNMDKAQILAMKVAVTYKLKGQMATMELLYNGDLTKILRVLNRPV